jgi:flavin-dependent thymidylate synthase
MQVILAGFNVDTEIIKELAQKSAGTMEITPESIAAAYARISRSSKPVHELRRLARTEVEKARRSNRRIIFEMGHHSVAEHAVFNFDILGVSRLAIEEIEKFRLCSFTEKSQRYVVLENDFVIPEELSESAERELFAQTIRKQNELYQRLLGELLHHLQDKHSDVASSPKGRSLLENLAKEDARYVTSMATESQLGLTVNARNLELLFRRFASHELHEIRELGRAIYRTVEHVVPSIILFVEANPYDRDTYPELRRFAETLRKRVPAHGKETEVDLADCTPDADLMTLSALLHTSTRKSFRACRRLAEAMTRKERMEWFKTAFNHMELYDSVLREFEYVRLTYSLVVSASCFAQLKRHRMATITVQPYDPQLGVTLPNSIRKIGGEDLFKETITATDRAYRTLMKRYPLAARYILTNAHRRRVLVGLNARELYHVSRLRQDPNAQWDIRRIAGEMVRKARTKMPLTMMLIGGKHEYPELYRKRFGHPPRVSEVPPPGLLSSE